MLIFDFRAIGNRLHAFRKKAGLTQQELAEAAGLSDRTYAVIERGSVNMRMETLLRICRALRITPDELCVETAIPLSVQQDEVLSRLNACSPKDKATALQLLDVYLKSL